MAQRLAVGNRNIYLRDFAFRIDLSQLEAESASVGPYDTSGGRAAIGTLLFTDASVKENLVPAGVDIDQFVGSGLRVGLTTHMLEGVTVRKTLDPSWASLGIFQWGVAPCAAQDPKTCWPDQSRLGGVSFREVRIGPDRGTNEYDPNWPLAGLPPEADQSLSLQFLNHAEFSESGYAGYEQSLRSRGLITEADEVNRAMRDHKRDQTWRESKGIFGKAVASV